MELIRGLVGIQKVPKHSMVALGDFSSLHRGDCHLLQTLVERARSLKTYSCVLFASDRPQSLLPLREQFSLFAQLGVDGLVCLRPSDVRSLHQPGVLVDLLCSTLQARFLCCAQSATLGEQLLDNQRPSLEVMFCHEPRVDEVHLAQCLQQGDFESVCELLGRWYRLSGRVVHGDKRGRVLGFPTANVNLKRFKPPIAGVFAVSLVVNGQALRGVANLGRRPSVDGVALRFEVHVFDFDGDLYGQFVHVYPHYKIRDEQAFQTLSALQTQISADVVAAQDWFATNVCLDGKLKTDDERL